jgi:hypothetical protein
MLSIKLNKPDEYPIVVVPGYSFKSFCSMLKIILDNLTDIIDKYSNLYMISWSPEVKDTSEKIIEGITDIDIKYEINEREN